MTCRKKMKRPWRVFRTVNIHAKTMTLLLTISKPKSHVSPSNGSRMAEALIRLLM